MRSLIVEDEFTSRKILQCILQAYGECDVAVDGDEATSAFHDALERDMAYDLVCLDIMLPKSNGHEVLETLRDMEEARGIPVGKGVKVIMTTSLSDGKTVMAAFNGGCEAYLVKPVDRDKVTNELRKLSLAA